MSQIKGTKVLSFVLTGITTVVCFASFCKASTDVVNSMDKMISKSVKEVTINEKRK